MKKIYNILGMAVVVFLSACTTAERQMGDPEADRGVISVEVVNGGAGADDYIYTARFIVFDNVSVFPSLDINKVIKMDDEQQKAGKFKVMLKVSCNPDKMVAVVLNEPASLTRRLSLLSAPADMEDIMFMMADVMNDNHTGPSKTGLPMTGTAWGVSVGEENDSETNAVRLDDFIVWRSLARVELWLKEEEGVDASIDAATNATMSNSHDRGYLVGPDSVHGFGKMMTEESPATEVSWTYPGSASTQLGGDSILVCAFYTPERTCSQPGDADKLVLEIKGISADGEYRDARTVLTEFAPPGEQPQELTEIRRNNVYRITGVVRKKSVNFGLDIIPWTDAAIGGIIDPQYFLRLDRDHYTLTDNGESVAIPAETNYDRSDRGFPRGIVPGGVKYYDKNGAETGSGDGDIYGWLDVALAGAEGDLARSVVLSAQKDLDEDNRGYYAIVEIRAGNLTKQIKITRA